MKLTDRASSYRPIPLPKLLSITSAPHESSRTMSYASTSTIQVRLSCGFLPHHLQHPRPHPSSKARDVLLANNPIMLWTTELSSASWWVVRSGPHRIGQIFARAPWPPQRIPCIIHLDVVCCDKDWEDQYLLEECLFENFVLIGWPRWHLENWPASLTNIVKITKYLLHTQTLSILFI